MDIVRATKLTEKKAARRGPWPNICIADFGKWFNFHEYYQIRKSSESRFLTKVAVSRPFI